MLGEQIAASVLGLVQCCFVLMKKNRVRSASVASAFRGEGAGVQSAHFSLVIGLALLFAKAVVWVFRGEGGVAVLAGSWGGFPVCPCSLAAGFFRESLALFVIEALVRLVWCVDGVAVFAGSFFRFGGGASFSRALFLCVFGALCCAVALVRSGSDVGLVAVFAGVGVGEGGFVFSSALCRALGLFWRGHNDRA